MSFSRLTFCVILALVTSLTHAQEHEKCITGPAPSNNKSPKPLFPLPTDFTDSIVSGSGQFVIYYNENVPDGATPIEYAIRAAEECDSAYDFEVLKLGYTAPVLTNGLHYVFYLSPLHRLPERPYGATYWLDDGRLQSSQSGNIRMRSYCEIENSFPDSIYATSGYDALRTTIFHEFFHMVQFSGYGMPPTAPDYTYFQEMSSTWMELRSTPYVKDYLQYAHHYLASLELRFDQIPGLGKYGQYLFLAYLSGRYGDTIVREMWETFRDNTTDPMRAIEDAMWQHGAWWCNTYQEFGAELSSLNDRLALSNYLPDATALPISAINVHHILNAGSEHVQALALSLIFAETIGKSNCTVIIAPDTDRYTQGTLTITATSDNAVVSSSAGRYCDTIICSPAISVLPNPFVMSSSGHDTALFFATSKLERPVKLMLDIYSIRRMHVRSIDLGSTTPNLPSRADQSWYAPWDGRDDRNLPVESGEYIYKLNVDGALKIGKIVVIRRD